MGGCENWYSSVYYAISKILVRREIHFWSFPHLQDNITSQRADYWRGDYFQLMC